MPELLKSFLRIAQETYHCAFGQFGAHERKTETGAMQNCSVSGAKSVRVLTYAVGRKVMKGALFDGNFAAFYFWRGEASNGQRLQSQYHSVLGIRLPGRSEALLLFDRSDRQDFSETAEP